MYRLSTTIRCPYCSKKEKAMIELRASGKMKIKFQCREPLYMLHFELVKWHVFGLLDVQGLIRDYLVKMFGQFKHIDEEHRIYRDELEQQARFKWGLELETEQIELSAANLFIIRHLFVNEISDTAELFFTGPINIRAKKFRIEYAFVTLNP